MIHSSASSQSPLRAGYPDSAQSAAAQVNDRPTLSPATSKSILWAMRDAGAALRCAGASVRAAALGRYNAHRDGFSYLGQESLRRIAGALINATATASAQAVTLQYSQNPLVVAAMAGLASSATKSYIAEAISKLGKNCKLPESRVAKAIEFADQLLDAGAYMAGAGLLLSFAKQALETENPTQSLVETLTKYPETLFAMALTTEAFDLAIHRVPIALAKVAVSDARIESRPASDFFKPLNLVSSDAVKMHIDFGIRVAANAVGVGSLKLVADLTKPGEKALSFAQLGPANAAAVSLLKTGHSYLRNFLFEKLKGNSPSDQDARESAISDPEAGPPVGNMHALDMAPEPEVINLEAGHQEEDMPRTAQLRAPSTVDL